jgi:hypothetical protein
MKRIALILISLAVSTSVLAADARKIDFTRPILDGAGMPMHETDDKSPTATVGFVASFALYRAAVASDPRAPAPDAVKVAKRAILALKIATATDAELTAEEVSEIKSVIGIFPPLYVLRTLQAIDPAAVK